VADRAAKAHAISAVEVSHGANQIKVTGDPEIAFSPATSFEAAQLHWRRCKIRDPTGLAGLAFLSAQQSLQPANTVISDGRALAGRSIKCHAERKLSQGRPIFRELHPSDTIGRVGGDFRSTDALLRPLLTFADAFHSQSPLAPINSIRARFVSILISSKRKPRLYRRESQRNVATTPSVDSKQCALRKTTQAMTF
jgi:hypothetical protein